MAREGEEGGVSTVYYTPQGGAIAAHSAVRWGEVLQREEEGPSAEPRLHHCVVEHVRREDSACGACAATPVCPETSKHALATCTTRACLSLAMAFARDTGRLVLAADVTEESALRGFQLCCAPHPGRRKRRYLYVCPAAACFGANQHLTFLPPAFSGDLFKRRPCATTTPGAGGYSAGAGGGSSPPGDKPVHVERCFWCHRFNLLTRPPCHGIEVYELRQQQQRVVVSFPCNLLMEPTKLNGNCRPSVRYQLSRRDSIEGAVAVSPEEPYLAYLCLSCASSALLMDAEGYRWIHDLLFFHCQLVDLLQLGLRLPEGWEVEGLEDAGVGDIHFHSHGTGDTEDPCGGTGPHRSIVVHPDLTVTCSWTVGEGRHEGGEEEVEETPSSPPLPPVVLLGALPPQAACTLLWWKDPQRPPRLQCVTGLYLLMDLLQRGQPCTAPAPSAAAPDADPMPEYSVSSHHHRCLGVVFPVPSDNPPPPPSSSLVCAHCWPGAGHGQ